ncbi:hypothetical protein NS184_08370 [Curtobacterium luteum]|uniref:Uncharacterized protein n=1 Tax=Curtobacterium luteum TaxID=33881 RepID=A0A175RUX1_9MICO|nr:hypothetical protein NS184_08370 [Curtobacterium luteum]
MVANTEGVRVGDLQVDTASLDALTHAMAPLPSTVRMDRSIADPREDALGSATVAAALGEAGTTITDRGEVLAESLTSIGQYPAQVAFQISTTEGELAAQLDGR